MKSMRYKPVGWQHESYRHYLAAMGISTRGMSSRTTYLASKGIHTRSGYLGSVQGVRIVAKKLPAGQMYPVSPQAVGMQLLHAKPDDLKGLKAVEFVPPRNKEQEGAYAQYVRSKRKVLIFSQKEQSTEQERLMREYVVPHELGHHKALHIKKITDKDLAVAEARADAHVVGLDVDDRDVKRLVHKV